MYYHCKELGVPISFGLGASIDFEAGNIASSKMDE